MKKHGLMMLRQAAIIGAAVLLAGCGQGKAKTTETVSAAVKAEATSAAIQKVEKAEEASQQAETAAEEIQENAETAAEEIQENAEAAAAEVQENTETAVVEDPMEDPSILTYPEIQDVQGIYITKGESGFLQAPEGHMWQMLDTSVRYYTNMLPANVYAIDPMLVSVPDLKADDQLAVICSNPEQPVYIYPVEEDGYTIRARFTEKGIQPFGQYKMQGQTIQPLITPVEDVNDQPYADFLAGETVNTLEAYSADPGNYSTDHRLLRAEEGKTYTIGHFEGTAYQSDTYTADIHYFAYDSVLNPKPEYPIQLTKNGYGVIDTSGLANGYYVIQSYIQPVHSAKQSAYIVRIDR